MDRETDITKQWLENPPAGAEKPGFKPEEMIVCEKCSRKNPPTRFQCFYCAADLKISEAQAASIAPALRQMESWEKGYNVILINNGPASYSEENIRTAAGLIGWETPEVKKALTGKAAIPVVRADSKQAAQTVKERLENAGFGSFIWADEEIDLDTPTRRLRGLNFGAETITFYPFNNGEPHDISWSEVVLVVSGGLFEKRVASTEKHNKKKEKNQITESTETSHDEPVMDIYSREDDTGWRVLTKGFDFSCLGAQKSLLAVENIKRLGEVIRQHAKNAGFDSNYLESRAALGKVWANEEKTASRNLQRAGMGSFNFDNVTVADNNAQFTKYSRLQRRLLKETSS